MKLIKKYSILITLNILFLMLAIFLICKKEESHKDIAVMSLTQYNIDAIYGKNSKKELTLIPYPYLKITLANKEMGGYIVSSEDLNLVEHGYKTKVKVFLFVNRFKYVLKVILHDIKETPKQVEMIKANGMIEKWQGKRVTDPLPESITGATQTSHAINRNVRKLLTKIQAIK